MACTARWWWALSWAGSYCEFIFHYLLTCIPFFQLNLGGSQLPLDPMVTNMAMNYGADIVNQKKKEVEGMVEKYVSIGQLKVVEMVIA